MSNLRSWWRLWLSLCLVLMTLTASAHQTGNSYINIRHVNDQLAIDLDFYVRDLDNLLQEDAKSGEAAPSAPSLPSSDQLQALQPRITEVIQRSFKLEIDELNAPLTFKAQSVTLHNDGLYVRQQFVGPVVDVKAKFIVIRYEFFTQNDKLGRAFMRLLINGDEISSVFDQPNAIQRFALGETKRSATIFLFAKEGAKHIWEGIDHLLFLLTLLLPGLLLWRHEVATPTIDNPKSMRGTKEAEIFALKVVTAFTIAHSITLGLATFGLVSLPEKLIESLIAFSIMASAAINLQKKYRINHWQLAFIFGLIHGMGFANGLKELGLSSSYFLETLLAFNVGVELAQLAIVLLVSIPMLLFVRSETAKHRVMTWGSIGVLAISTVWLVQRLMA
jgi:hypothetical protein